MRDIESERRQREEVLQQKRDDLKARQSQLSTTNHHRAQLEQAITRAKEKTYQLRYSSLMICLLWEVLKFSYQSELFALYTCQLSHLQIENLDLTPTYACVPICLAW